MFLLTVDAVAPSSFLSSSPGDPKLLEVSFFFAHIPDVSFWKRDSSFGEVHLKMKCQISSYFHSINTCIYEDP